MTLLSITSAKFVDHHAVFRNLCRFGSPILKYFGHPRSGALACKLLNTLLYFKPHVPKYVVRGTIDQYMDSFWKLTVYPYVPKSQKHKISQILGNLCQHAEIEFNTSEYQVMSGLVIEDSSILSKTNLKKEDAMILLTNSYNKDDNELFMNYFQLLKNNIEEFPEIIKFLLYFKHKGLPLSADEEINNILQNCNIEPDSESAFYMLKGIMNSGNYNALPTVVMKLGRSGVRLSGSQIVNISASLLSKGQHNIANQIMSTYNFEFENAETFSCYLTELLITCNIEFALKFWEKYKSNFHTVLINALYFPYHALLDNRSTNPQFFEEMLKKDEFHNCSHIFKKHFVYCEASNLKMNIDLHELIIKDEQFMNDVFPDCSSIERFLGNSFSETLDNMNRLEECNEFYGKLFPNMSIKITPAKFEKEMQAFSQPSVHHMNKKTTSLSAPTIAYLIGSGNFERFDKVSIDPYTDFDYLNNAVSNSAVYIGSNDHFHKLAVFLTQIEDHIKTNDAKKFIDIIISRFCSARKINRQLIKNARKLLNYVDRRRSFNRQKESNRSTISYQDKQIN